VVDREKQQSVRHTLSSFMNLFRSLSNSSLSTVRDSEHVMCG